eukprot:scaffold329221_cov39-Prasinocladus_malaysianus.AAC.1
MVLLEVFLAFELVGHRLAHLAVLSDERRRRDRAGVVGVAHPPLEREHLRGQSLEVDGDGVQQLPVGRVLRALAEHRRRADGGAGEVFRVPRVLGLARPAVPLDAVQHGERGMCEHLGGHQALHATARPVVSRLEVEAVVEAEPVLVGRHHRGDEQVEQDDNGGEHGGGVDQLDSPVGLHDDLHAREAQKRHDDEVRQDAHVALVLQPNVDAQRLVYIFALLQVGPHEQPEEKHAEARRPDADDKDEAKDVRDDGRHGEEQGRQLGGYLEDLRHLYPQQTRGEGCDVSPDPQHLVHGWHILGEVQGLLPMERVRLTKGVAHSVRSASPHASLTHCKELGNIFLTAASISCMVTNDTIMDFKVDH